MSWSPASGRKEIEAALRQVGGQPDSEIAVAEAALLLAALDRPRVPFERYLHHLSLLTRDTADLGAKHAAADRLAGRIEALRAVIHERYGYGGDRLGYDDLQNANLMRVVDRRKGLPVALGILYLHAARAQGWAIEGLNFPGHFMLRLSYGSERMIVDPFNGGIPRSPAALREILRSLTGEEAELKPEHTDAVSDRAVLLRLQNNIKLRRIKEERPAEALEVVESMLMIAPGQAEIWREAGVLNAHLGNLRAATTALEHFLALGGDANPQTRHDAAVLLQKLRSRMN